MRKKDVGDKFKRFMMVSSLGLHAYVPPILGFFPPTRQVAKCPTNEKRDRHANKSLSRPLLVYNACMPKLD